MFLSQLVSFLFKHSFLYLVLEYLSAQVIKFGGHRVHLGADKCAGFVNKVYRLVGQKSVSDVSVRQHSRSYQCLVLYLYAVKDFIALFQTAQYGDGVLNSRFVHHNGLEASFKGFIFFDELPVLIESSRADAVQFASCQHRFQQVACVHSAVRLARAHDGMKFVNEQYYPALRLLYLFNDRFEALFKLAPVLCACDKASHIQREYLPVL